MNWGGGQRSFSDTNKVRRQRSIQMQKQREARRARSQELADQAISRMQQNANIFSIKSDASYSSVEQTLIVAQQRAIDAAAAKQSSGLGQNASVVA
ncbi:MAG: hypothetical protein OCD03_12995 [Hyphomicrobiales bacterium]